MAIATYKFTKETFYDQGYGYTRVYSCGNFNIQREGKQKEFGGCEDKGDWSIDYKGTPFKGVIGTVPTLKIAKAVCIGYLKKGY
jgi:hypothetical protein